MQTMSSKPPICVRARTRSEAPRGVSIRSVILIIVPEPRPLPMVGEEEGYLAFRLMGVRCHSHHLSVQRNVFD